MNTIYNIYASSLLCLKWKPKIGSLDLQFYELIKMRCLAVAADFKGCQVPRRVTAVED